MTESFFYVLCTTLPSHIIAFAQFWDYPWRSKKLAVTLISANLLFKMLTMIGAMQNGWNTRVIELLISLVGAAIYFFFIRADKFKLLFSYVLIIDYLVVVRGIASFISTRLLHSDFQSWQASMICIVIYLLTLPWMMHFFRKMSFRIYQTDAPAVWHTIWLIPALTTLVVLLFTNTYRADSAENWRALLARLSLMCSTLVVCFILVRTMSEIGRKAALEEQNRQNQYILSLQRSQFAALQDHIEQIRRARHDLRQHQNIIQAFLDSGNTDAMRAYLRELSDSAAVDSPRVFCRNYPINLLLNHYAGVCDQLHIPFECVAALPEKLPAGEPDVCVVIGNLLENALHACTGQPQPWVRIVIKMVPGQCGLTILADNSAPVPPKTRADGSFISDKGENSGIGTQSVQYIAKQYGGTADFHWEDGRFMASVFLNLPPENAENPPDPEG